MSTRYLNGMCINTLMIGLLLFISTPAAASLIMYEMRFFITPTPGGGAGSGVLIADITGDPSTSSLVSFVGVVAGVSFDSTILPRPLSDFTEPSDYNSTDLLNVGFSINQSNVGPAAPFLDVNRDPFASGFTWQVYTFGPVTVGELYTLERVPVPPALWLFGSGLIGLIGVARRKTIKGVRPL